MLGIKIAKYLPTPFRKGIIPKNKIPAVSLALTDTSRQPEENILYSRLALQAQDFAGLQRTALNLSKQAVSLQDERLALLSSLLLVKVNLGARIAEEFSPNRINLETYAIKGIRQAAKYFLENLPDEIWNFLIKNKSWSQAEIAASFALRNRVKLYLVTHLLEPNFLKRVSEKLSQKYAGAAKDLNLEENEIFKRINYKTLGNIPSLLSYKNAVFKFGIFPDPGLSPIPEFNFMTAEEFVIRAGHKLTSIINSLAIELPDLPQDLPLYITPFNFLTSRSFQSYEDFDTFKKTGIPPGFKKALKNLLEVEWALWELEFIKLMNLLSAPIWNLASAINTAATTKSAQNKPSAEYLQSTANNILETIDNYFAHCRWQGTLPPLKYEVIQPRIAAFKESLEALSS